MTKPKKSEKSKNPSHSEPKAPTAAHQSAGGKGEGAAPKGKRGGKATAGGEAVAAATPVSEPAKAPANVPLAEIPIEDGEVVLTDAEGRRYCRATDCDQIGLVDGYCRYHYLYFWKKIQVRKKILADGKLERYIEELTARYTDKFIELLRKDLRTEKDFLAAVQELELDDSTSGGSQQEEDDKTYLEEISGVSQEAPSRDDDSY